MDDDVELGEMLTEYLEREGFGAMAVPVGEAAQPRAVRRVRHVVLDDDAAPERHGCAASAPRTAAPVLMLTVKGTTWIASSDWNSVRTTTCPNPAPHEHGHQYPPSLRRPSRGTSQSTVRPADRGHRRQAGKAQREELQGRSNWTSTEFNLLEMLTARWGRW